MSSLKSHGLLNAGLSQVAWIIWCREVTSRMDYLMLGCLKSHGLFGAGLLQASEITCR